MYPVPPAQGRAPCTLAAMPLHQIFDCLLYRKDKDLTLHFKHCYSGHSTFCHISDGSTWYLRYWLHGFEFGVHGTWFRGYGVPGF